MRIFLSFKRSKADILNTYVCLNDNEKLNALEVGNMRAQAN